MQVDLVNGEKLTDLSYMRLGPTNTGKTHRSYKNVGEWVRHDWFASTAVGARVYDRLVAETNERDVALLTGEESYPMNRILCMYCKSTQ